MSSASRHCHMASSRANYTLARLIMTLFITKRERNTRVGRSVARCPVPHQITAPGNRNFALVLVPLRRQQQPEHCCRLRLQTLARCGGTMPSAHIDFYYSRRSCFGPTKIVLSRTTDKFGGAAGYRPRVRKAYSVTQFSAVVGLPRQPLYRSNAPRFTRGIGKNLF